MKIYINQGANIGNAKAFLLRQVLATAAQQQGHEIVADAAHAELAIAFNQMPNNAQLQGKKVFVIEAEQAFNAPEQAIQNALAQAVDYVCAENSQQSTVESAVENLGLSAQGTKNIVAVTACPTGVAHTFMSAEAISEYAKKQGWNVKVETRGQVGSSNIISRRCG